MTSGVPLPHAALEATFNQAHAQSLVIRGPLRRISAVVGDLFGVVALVFCVPFVLLAIGAPIALSVRLLLWIGGLL